LSLTFTPANWNVAQTVTVRAVDDTARQGDRTRPITHTAASPDARFQGMTIPSVNVLITDNDPISQSGTSAGVTITQSGGSTAVAEGGAADTYAVVLNRQPTADVTVTIQPGGQLTVAPSVLTFTPANWNEFRIVTVGAVDDAAVEGAHSGTITHTATSADAGYQGLTIASVNVAITDNDSGDGGGVMITQSGGNTAVTEGGFTDTYTVVLIAPPTSNVTITIQPDNQQLSLSPLELTFTPANWNTAQTVLVQAADDSAAEGNHDSTITHTAASADSRYQGISIASVNVVILDNDVGNGGGSEPPQAIVEGPVLGVRGQPGTFTVGAGDPSPGDEAAGFTYVINWGDNSPVQVIAPFANNGVGTAVSHVFTRSGTFNLQVTAIDQQGVQSIPAGRLITITSFALQPDPANPTLTALVVGGTTGKDTIVVKPKKKKVVVVLNGQKLGTFKPSQVIIHGQGGDDVIKVKKKVKVPVEVADAGIVPEAASTLNVEDGRLAAARDLRANRSPSTARGSQRILRRCPPASAPPAHRHRARCPGHRCPLRNVRGGLVLGLPTSMYLAYRGRAATKIGACK
jgi:hypothetical protein